MQANENFRLIVRRGPQPNQVYELTGDVSNVGRDITNNIVINDREVSRHHLRLMRGADGYTVEDLGSTRGTFINGKRVTGATPLKNGDMLGMGETVTLQFEVSRPGASAPSPSPTPPPAAQEAQEERFKRPPQQQAENPYQPQPQEAYQQPPQQSYQPQQNAYQPPAQSYSQPDPYAAQPEQQGYGQQHRDAYNQQQYDYNSPAAAYGPPPPGYDYDPYTMREEEGGGIGQWVLIGCLGIVLVCCCATVIGAVAVDSLCLYNSIPGLNSIMEAVGFVVQCAP
ncbi:MAG: FHA domain-containing protein [Anaerolineae bacterium]|nr:FHA domain-containing protein [Anaerolineae bacterium]